MRISDWSSDVCSSDLSKTALGAVHSEETAHFGQNAIEGARLVAIASLDDIAMHRVAGPDDRMAFALNGADERGQARFELIMSIARDERHASRLPTALEKVKHAQQRIGTQAGTTVYAYRIATTAQILENAEGRRLGTE